MIMDNSYNPFSELFRKIETLEKNVDLILRRMGKVDFYDEFNVEGLSSATKVLGYKSTKTLKNKIEKGDILKENIHYRVSDGGRYFFSKGALLSIKGLV